MPYYLISLLLIGTIFYIVILVSLGYGSAEL